MNNAELQQRKQAVFARGEGNAYGIYVAKAKNAELWDVEGNVTLILVVVSPW
jgi:4-aminobutyrate aminotransferase apoenzyme (EC 2.6.1.19)